MTRNSLAYVVGIGFGKFISSLGFVGIILVITLFSICFSSSFPLLELRIQAIH